VNPFWINGFLIAALSLASGSAGAMAQAADRPEAASQPPKCPHQFAPNQCGLCNPAQDQAGGERESTDSAPRWRRGPSPNCTNGESIVRLASAEIAQTAGLEFVEVKSAPLERAVERNVELDYNANRYARLASRVPGAVVQVAKDLGEPVSKGDVLVVVESADLGAAKADLLQAAEMLKLWRSNAARERSLVEKGIGVEREALEAETKAAEAMIEVNKARQQLRILGLSAEQIQAVEQDGESSSLLAVRAPFDGLVVERAAVQGEVVDATRTLVSISDTKTMWAMVDLLESDFSLVQVGQRAAVRFDGLPGKVFAGRITWISTQINEKTRTVKGRIELENQEGLLRAHMFGKAAISLEDRASAVTVPKQAVQWEGCCNVAFVKMDDSGLAFRAARLSLGFDTGAEYEVIDGLNAGEIVVAQGSFILKNEMLKSAIGAGCCEVEHLKK
jgi:cobalt-zinc-cadmium efflux system membrane fusion protein